LTEPCTEKETIAVLKTHQTEIRSDIKTILQILQGNGNEGLKTKVALHGKYFKLIAAVGGLILTGRIVWGYIFP